jgi:hypothetical protein
MTTTSTPLTPGLRYNGLRVSSTGAVEREVCCRACSGVGIAIGCDACGGTGNEWEPVINEALGALPAKRGGSCSECGTEIAASAAYALGGYDGDDVPFVVGRVCCRDRVGCARRALLSKGTVTH